MNRTAVKHNTRPLANSKKNHSGRIVFLIKAQIEKMKTEDLNWGDIRETVKSRVGDKDCVEKDRSEEEISDNWRLGGSYVEKPAHIVQDD
jgi:hypothetical protein